MTDYLTIDWAVSLYFAYWIVISYCSSPLFVQGHRIYLDKNRTRTYCGCSRCGWGLFLDIFSLVYHFSFLSPSLWEMARYWLKYCLKGPLSPAQKKISFVCGQTSRTVGTASDSRGPKFHIWSGHILSFLLPLIQEGQLSVTGDCMWTKYWLTAQV